MNSKNFRAYDQAVALYRMAKAIQLPHGLKDQLMRASSSVALNLREGSTKPGPKERRRFYLIAFASLREVQGITDLEPEPCQSLIAPADTLAGCLYRPVTSGQSPAACSPEAGSQAHQAIRLRAVIEDTR